MKSPFQDIIPPEKRSIRNIPIQRQTEGSSVEQIVDTSIGGGYSQEANTQDIKREFSRNSYADEPHKETLVFTGTRSVSPISKFLLWLSTIGAVLVLFFTVTYFLTSATIGVTTKKLSVELPKTTRLSLTQEEGSIKYSTVTMSDTISTRIASKGEKEVEFKAKGTIVVYNNYDSNPQKLTLGTRFETPSGLIFKSTKPIVVPGKSKVSGKDVAGSVEVVVEAEKSGPEYNIPLSDFTIPGLKGDPRYTAFYARSKTVMSGGSIGKVAIVDDKDVAQATDKAKPDLNKKLIEKLRRELPENQLLMSGLTDFDYEIAPPKLDKDVAVLELKVNAKAYLIDGTSLARLLLKSEGQKFSDEDSFKLDISLASARLLSATSTTPVVEFEGKAGVEYVLDTTKFLNEVVGIQKADMPQIALKYNAISDISTVVKPFWKDHLPNSKEKIKVITK